MLQNTRDVPRHHITHVYFFSRRQAYMTKRRDCLTSRWWQAILRDKATEDMGDDEADGRDDSGGAAASDAFFAVDVECVLHKYRRWHECFPRVKPFYGQKCGNLDSSQHTLIHPHGIIEMMGSCHLQRYVVP